MRHKDANLHLTKSAALASKQQLRILSKAIIRIYIVFQKMDTLRARQSSADAPQGCKLALGQEVRHCFQKAISRMSLYICFLSRNIELELLFRSHALLGQLQVCILVGAQQPKASSSKLKEPKAKESNVKPSKAPKSKAQKPKAKALAKGEREEEPWSLKCVSNVLRHPADCFAQETELLFGSQCRASWSSAGLHSCVVSAEPSQVAVTDWFASLWQLTGLHPCGASAETSQIAVVAHQHSPAKWP